MTAEREQHAKRGFFSEVRRLFSLRPEMSSLPSMDDKLAELQLRLACMEEAMARLDRRGLFGSDSVREQILISAEIMPPEYSSTQRAVRLNPPGALSDWMAEYAEPAP